MDKDTEDCIISALPGIPVTSNNNCLSQMSTAYMLQSCTLRSTLYQTALVFTTKDQQLQQFSIYAALSTSHDTT